MAKWEYNKYRATLTKDGKFFALVTPDGKEALNDRDSKELLDQLNGKGCNGTVHSQAILSGWKKCPYCDKELIKEGFDCSDGNPPGKHFGPD